MLRTQGCQCTGCGSRYFQVPEVATVFWKFAQDASLFYVCADMRCLLLSAKIAQHCHTVSHVWANQSCHQKHALRYRQDI